MADILSQKNKIILTQKKARVQKKIKIILKPAKVVISVLKNIKSINIIIEVVKKNRESPTLLKERQLTNIDKNKWNLRNSLLLYNIKFIMPEKQNNFQIRLFY